MACKVTAAFYAVLVLGIIAVGLHVIGFTTTGWVIMSRKFTVEEIQFSTKMVIEEAIRMADIDIEERQRIDDGGVVVPDDQDRPVPPPPGEGPHDKPMHGKEPSEKPTDMNQPPPERRRHLHIEVVQETTQVQEWIKESVVEIEHVYLKLKYGLWKSKLCMSAKLENLENEEEDETSMDKKDDSSSSSEEGRKRHRHRCHCRHISTKCALAMSTMFMDMSDVKAIENEEHKPWYKFNTKYFLGNTCLTEHRVETTIALVLLVLAVVTGIMAFRKKDACRCWNWTCLICLLVAFVMVSIPVHRVLRYNYHEVKDNLTGSKVHMPYALFSSLLSAVVTFILAILVAVALCRRNRNSKKWQRFEDEADPIPEKKGMPPSLVFIPEPLTGEKKPMPDQESF